MPFTIMTNLGIKDRLGIADMLNDCGLTGSAAEIGVWLGHYSVPFLDRWRGDKMYLVDPWAKLPPEEYDDVRNTKFDPADYGRACEAFSRFGPRAEMVRMTSVRATEKVPDGLDFVYIDANHAYEHVWRDMVWWWNKLAPKAVLAGHDAFSISHPGVSRAVFEFAMCYDLPLELIKGDYDRHGNLYNDHSWLIRKGW